MRALILNCTLTARPEQSNTEALVDVVAAAMRREGIDVDVVHVADHDVKPGVSDGEGDEWPAVLALLRNAEILVIATPTWRSEPSSIAERVLERMDALVAETDEQGRPFAYNRVGGIVVTGHEDGAHHVIAEVARSLIDIGYTVPGQAWTYWNMGPRPGPSYLETDHEHDWSERTGRTAAANLVAVARALAEGPMPAPAE
ncbi:MAG TPA: NAD(P)H-dependent oxidoreductase [Acidimicrobiia bacterium]|jgi:multimeric flavodoxin WrbA|nr:NAD(P)H-dependent oxidoreductase [Acidimicrobiia bacterium]